MGSHDPFRHLTHKLWPKEGLRIKLAIWFSTIKSWESPQFTCMQWSATYRCKALNKRYKFSSDLISIGGLHAKLCAPKVVGVPTMGISRLPFGSPRTKYFWNFFDDLDKIWGWFKHFIISPTNIFLCIWNHELNVLLTIPMPFIWQRITCTHYISNIVNGLFRQ